MRYLLGVSVVALSMLLVACASSRAPMAASSLKEPLTRAYDTVRITAVGYGAVSQQERLSDQQKQLLGIRASKVDAYRNLAEQVYGFRINGITSVSSLAVRNDHFRSYVEGAIRGARVASINPTATGIFETTLELELNSTFFNCLTLRTWSENTCSRYSMASDQSIGGTSSYDSPWTYNDSSWTGGSEIR